MKGKKRSVDKAEEVQLIRQAQEGSQEAMSQLLRLFRRLVCKLAHRHARSKAELFQDLVQVGLEGVVKAVRRFDPSQSNCPSTYIYPTVEGAMLHYLRDHEPTVKVPRRLLNLRSRAEQLTRERNSLGLPGLSREEMARVLGVTAAVLDRALVPLGAHIVSLDAEQFEAGNVFSKGTSLYGLLADTDNEMELVSDRVAVRQLLQHLDPRQRTVITMLFGLDNREPVSQSAVAKYLGISQMHVSRIRAQALQALKEQLCTAVI